MNDIKINRLEWLKKELMKINNNKNIVTSDLILLSTKLYEKGYSGLDILHLLERQNFLDKIITIKKRYELLVCFNNVRKEFRNEKLLILFILNFIFLSSEHCLENITFM
jgi:hypothetical protein